MIFLHIKTSELARKVIDIMILGHHIISVGKLRDDGTHLVTVLRAALKD